MFVGYTLTDDGAGGKFVEPQGRAPIFFGDLDPQFQRLILRGLQAATHGHPGAAPSEGEAQPA